MEDAVAKGTATSDPDEIGSRALRPLRKGQQPAITDIARRQKMIRDADKDYAHPVTRLALRFLALTAVRPGELRGARWDKIDDLDGPQAPRQAGCNARSFELASPH